MRVTGLDLSLTSSGVGVIDSDGPAANRPGLPFCSVTRIKPTSKLVELKHDRISQIVPVIRRECRGSDLVVVESPAYNAGGANASALMGVWWIICHALWRDGFNVVDNTLVVVPPPTLKVYATGKGRVEKDEIVAETVRRYPFVEVHGNDMADAFQLAAMGWDKLHGRPLVELPQTHRRALAKWPYKKEPKRGRSKAVNSQDD